MNQESMQSQQLQALPKTSLWAIVSLVLGLLFPLGTIPAVIFGHLALSDIKKSAGTLRGQGLAIAGLVLGYLGIGMGLIMAVLASMLIPALSSAREEARQLMCKNNLKQVAAAIAQYLDTEGKHVYYPSDLKELVDTKIISEPAILLCPSSGTSPGGGWKCEYDSIFSLTRWKLAKLTDRLPANTMLVWDNKPRHKGGRCAVFRDTHAEYLPEAQFQQKLAETEKMLEELKE